MAVLGNYMAPILQVLGNYMDYMEGMPRVHVMGDYMVLVWGDYSYKQ